MNAPAAVPALAILAGTAAACCLRLPAPVPAAACALALAAAVAAYARRGDRAFLFAVSLAFGLGAWALAARSFRDAEDPPLRRAFAGALVTQERVVLEGRLRSDASAGPNGVSLDLEVASSSLPRRSAGGAEAGGIAGGAEAGGIRLTVAGSLAVDGMSEWRAGRRIRLAAALREPVRSLDPGVPDSRLDLARRGTALVGSVKSGLLVDVIRPGSWLDERAADFRAYARRAIGGYVGRWSDRASAIVMAILIGDRVGLDDEVQQKLREAGTYHVIAISGGNIAILAALIVLLLRVFRVPRRLGGWLAIAGLVAYADLVGGGASVVRATLMAAGYLAARQVDHRSPPLNALAAACGLVLVVTPRSLCDAAFALTFGATLGILLGAQVLGFVDATGRIPRLPGLLRSTLRAVCALFVASLSAELALFPVSALAFSRVTFAGLLLNFVAIPLMSVAQVAGMAVLLAAAIWPGGAVAAGWLAHLGAEGLVRSASFVDLAPWLSWRLPPPHAAVIACYYAAWCGWLWLRHASSPRRGWRATCVAVLVASGAWILTEPISLLFPGVSGRLRVTVLDVGHADAVLIQLPDRRSLLVDAAGSMTGSAFDVGGRVVAPALWALGTRRLDALIISHADPDHVGGAGSVMRDFHPREVWEGIPVPQSALKHLRELAGQQHAAWRERHAGDVVDFGDVTLRVCHPDPPEWERRKVRNDDSLVIELRYGGVSFVLPGDAGAAVERRLATCFAPARLRVLKVPHHGSSTSSSPEFLAALAPSVAIVSAAQNTVVPPQVLARYRAVGSEIFRTSDDGAVTLTTDGRTVSVATFTGRTCVLDDTTKNTKDTKEGGL